MELVSRLVKSSSWLLFHLSKGLKQQSKATVQAGRAYWCDAGAPQGVRADQPQAGPVLELASSFMSLVPSLERVSGFLYFSWVWLVMPKTNQVWSMFPTRVSPLPPLWLPLFMGFSTDHFLWSPSWTCFPSVTTEQGVGCTPKIYPLEKCILGSIPQSPGRTLLLLIPWPSGPLLHRLTLVTEAYPSSWEQDEGWGLGTLGGRGPGGAGSRSSADER